MTTIQVQLSFDKLIGSLPQLSSAELTELAQQAAQIKAKRQARNLPSAEANLLLKINQGVIPIETRKRCATLTAQAKQAPLSDAEQAELAQLVDEIEQLNAQRIGYLVELAQLRGLSLEQLMTQLEITPLRYE